MQLVVELARLCAPKRGGNSCGCGGSTSASPERPAETVDRQNRRQDVGRETSKAHVGASSRKNSQTCHMATACKGQNTALTHSIVAGMTGDDLATLCSVLLYEQQAHACTRSLSPSAAAKHTSPWQSCGCLSTAAKDHLPCSRCTACFVPHVGAHLLRYVTLLHSTKEREP